MSVRNEKDSQPPRTNARHMIHEVGLLLLFAKLKTQASIRQECASRTLISFVLHNILLCISIFLIFARQSRIVAQEQQHGE